MEMKGSYTYRMARGPGYQRALGGLGAGLPPVVQGPRRAVVAAPSPTVGSQLSGRLRSGPRSPRTDPDWRAVRVRRCSVGTQTAESDWSVLAPRQVARGWADPEDDTRDLLREHLTFYRTGWGGLQPVVEAGEEATAWDLAAEESEIPQAETNELVEGSGGVTSDDGAEADPTPLTVTKVVIALPDKGLVCRVCTETLGTILRAVKHYTAHHGDVELEFQCRECGRTNPNSHSISCHVPKCKGRQVVESGGAFVCEECDQRWSTKIGLSQHKRHAHPAVRNAERIGLRVTKRSAQSRQGAHVSCWSEAEVEALMRLENRFAGRRNINKLIAEELGSKTNKQVGDKRRLLRQRNAARPTVPGDAVLASLEAATPLPDPTGVGVRESLFSAVAGLYGGKVEAEPLQVTRAWADNVDQVPVLVETSALRLLREWGRDTEGGASTIHGNARVDRATREPPRKSWERRRAAKRGEFARQQRLFRKDPSRLAALVMDGAESYACRIPVNEVTAHFRDRWEVERTFGGLGGFTPSGMADNAHLGEPVTPEEVLRSIAQVKNTTASGPDRISKRVIVEKDPMGERLAAIFNMWLLAGVVPNGLKRGRTVLLPKTMNRDEGMEVGNWRPITIGSLILRLFSRILTRRLAAACPLNPRQRGFISAPGCSENLRILQGILRHCKEKRNQLAVVFVDFAKAFDSISHEHILYALRQRRVDSHVVGIIQNSYTDCSSRIEVEGGCTPEIKMKVGVKQGDPLSPLLFNLALDPLINALETLGCGYRMGSAHLTTLAFADDLALVSGSWEGMARNLTILETFCRLTGLQIQVRKCYGFLITPSLGSYTVNDAPAWKINGTDMSMIGPAEAEKYLGVRVNPWVGLVRPAVADRLLEWVKRIGKAHLKPRQKVVILNAFAVPRLIYLLDHCDVKGTVLLKLDGIIRGAVKSWLHLPASTCNGLLYARPRDGGLGVTKLSSAIPSIQVKRLFRLANSADEMTSHVVRASGLEDEFQALWAKAGGDPERRPVLFPETGNQAPPAARVVCPVPCDWRRGEADRWGALPVQGVGYHFFRADTVSNAWITRSQGFRERHFIAAVQLRANVYPTREFLTRGIPNGPKTCRGCHLAVESCSHILGQCPAVQGARIVRHNKVCALLAGEARAHGWEVHEEPHFRTETGELRKPDLVVVKGGSILVIDVTVRFEYAPDSMERARAEKISHYSALATQISQEMGAEQVRFFGFVVGARGKWPAFNGEILTLLGLGKTRARRFAELVSRRTLLYSLDILGVFCGYSKRYVSWSNPATQS